MCACVVAPAGAANSGLLRGALRRGGPARQEAQAVVQTAIGEASGENADVANALLGVSFNLAIFTAGVLGALLISGGDG